MLGYPHHRDDGTKKAISTALVLPNKLIFDKETSDQENDMHTSSTVPLYLHNSHKSFQYSQDPTAKADENKASVPPYETKDSFSENVELASATTTNRESVPITTSEKCEEANEPTKDASTELYSMPISDLLALFGGDPDSIKVVNDSNGNPNIIHFSKPNLRVLNISKAKVAMYWFFQAYTGSFYEAPSSSEWVRNLVLEENVIAPSFVPVVMSGTKALSENGRIR